MRETRCPGCAGLAEIICYQRDDPVVFCHKCGTYVMTIEMQVIRDKYALWTDYAILDMYRKVAKMQKTFFGRELLRLKLLFGWTCPGIEGVLRLHKKTAHFVAYVKKA